MYCLSLHDVGIVDADFGTIDSKEQRSSFKALLLACRVRDGHY